MFNIARDEQKIIFEKFSGPESLWTTPEKVEIPQVNCEDQKPIGFVIWNSKT
jgi:hypothetical protein